MEGETSDKQHFRVRNKSQITTGHSGERMTQSLGYKKTDWGPSWKNCYKTNGKEWNEWRGILSSTALCHQLVIRFIQVIQFLCIRTNCQWNCQ